MMKKPCLYLTFIVVCLRVHIQADKEKRQIFREQVLPALGGKIPEEAFRTDRLALNRLNKEGITIPDGVVLEAPHPHVQHSHHGQSSTNDVLKVNLSRDEYNNPRAADTTYVIRKPIGHGGSLKTTYHGYKPHFFNKPQTFSNQKNSPLSPTIFGAHKPIIAPLILPSTNDFFKTLNYPSWTFNIYDWGTFYERLSDYYNKIALINSQQIITGYDEFWNDFHRRSQRHVSQKAYKNSNTLISRKEDLIFSSEKRFMI